MDAKRVEKEFVTVFKGVSACEVTAAMSGGAAEVVASRNMAAMQVRQVSLCGQSQNNSTT